MNKAREIWKEKIMKMVKEEVIPTRELLLNSYIEGMNEVRKTF